MKITISGSELPFRPSNKDLDKLSFELFSNFQVHMIYGLATGTIKLEGTEQNLINSILYLGFQLGLISEGK